MKVDERSSLSCEPSRRRDNDLLGGGSIWPVARVEIDSQSDGDEENVDVIDSRSSARGFKWKSPAISRPHREHPLRREPSSTNKKPVIRSAPLSQASSPTSCQNMSRRLGPQSGQGNRTGVVAAAAPTQTISSRPAAIRPSWLAIIMVAVGLLLHNRCQVEGKSRVSKSDLRFGLGVGLEMSLERIHAHHLASLAFRLNMQMSLF